MGIVGALGLCFSIVFYEMSHSLVARKYGIPMKGVTLFIFGGVAEMGDEPRSPKAEFMMAIIGPYRVSSSASFFMGFISLAAKTKGQSPSMEWVSCLYQWLIGFRQSCASFYSDRLLGCVTTKQVKEIPQEEWGQKSVGEIAAQCSPENTIGPHVDAMKALSTMSRTGASRLMVTEGNRLVGVIALKDMLKFLTGHGKSIEKPMKGGVKKCYLSRKFFVQQISANHPMKQLNQRVSWLATSNQNCALSMSFPQFLLYLWAQNRRLSTWHCTKGN